MTLKRKLLALVSSLFFATSVFAAPSISGPHVTMQTDGSLSTGQANIITNNAGPIQFFTNKTLCGYFDGSTCALTGVTVSGLVLGNQATFSTLTSASGTNGVIQIGTSNAADNKSLQIGGGGIPDPTRGAYAQFFGNEAGGGVSAALYLSTGDTAGADLFLLAKDDIRFQTDAGSEVGSWDTTTGNFSFNATFGGNFIMSKAGTGIIGGAAVLDTDLTAVVGAGPGFVSLKNTSSDSDNLDVVTFGANAVGSNIQAFKTRSTAGDANTIVNSGDTIFQLTGLGADGASYRRAASIVMTVDGTPGSSDMPGAIDFQTSPDGSATLASVLKLSNNKAAVFTGTVTSTAAADIGWNPVAAANQACNTTCATSGCVFGFNLTAGVPGTLLACTDATADVCLCAGAS